MTLQIEITPDLEAALAAKAARLGVPVERYAVGVLRRDVESGTDDRLKVFNELMDFAQNLPARHASRGLDLSGPRADTYGYSEREDSQR